MTESVDMFDMYEHHEEGLRIKDPVSVLKYLDSLPLFQQVQVLRKHIKRYCLQGALTDPCIECWITSNAEKLFPTADITIDEVEADLLASSNNPE